jgi:hypothetical protein
MLLQEDSSNISIIIYKHNDQLTLPSAKFHTKHFWCFTAVIQSTEAQKNIQKYYVKHFNDIN